MHVTGRVAYRRMCEWCSVYLCISRRSDIHTNTTVTLNVVHTSLRSCVVGRVLTGIQMGFYKGILETLYIFNSAYFEPTSCPIVSQNKSVVLTFPFAYSLGLPERF